MAPRRHDLQITLCLVLLLPLLKAASLKVNPPPPPPPDPAPGQFRQLTPSDCHLAKTQCPTLTHHDNYAGLDEASAFLRMQYEDSLRRMKIYFVRIIDTLMNDPSASALMLLCANMGNDDSWMSPDEPCAGSATSSQATSSQKMASQATSSHAMSSQPTSLQPTSSQPTSSQPTSSQTMISQTMSTKVMSSQAAFSATPSETTSSPMTLFHPMSSSTPQTHSSTISKQSLVPQSTPEVSTADSKLPSSTSAPMSSDPDQSAVLQTSLMPGQSPSPQEWNSPMMMTAPRGPENEETTTESSEIASSSVTPAEEATAEEESLPVQEALTSVDPSSNLSKSSTRTTKSDTVKFSTSHETIPTSQTVTTGSLKTSPAETTTVTPTPSSTSPSTPATTAPGCVVSEWSEWSSPVGFGVQVRDRAVVRPVEPCPQKLNLMEKRTVVHDSTQTPLSENVTLVADNFRKHFIRRTSGPRDIMVVIDSSQTVTLKDMFALEDGLTRMLHLFCQDFGNGNADNRLALVLFSNDASGFYMFKNDQTPEILALVLQAAYVTQGSRCTEEALDFARFIFSGNYGARNNASHDTLLITNGRSNCARESVKSSATALQQLSTVSALGVDLDDDQEAVRELGSVVTGEDPRRLFSLSSFELFPQMVKSVADRYASREGCV